MATPTRVFPLARTPNGLPLGGLPGVPMVEQELATKAEAEALVATGHFTLDARDADRVPSEPEPSRKAEATPAPEPATDTDKE